MTIRLAMKVKRSAIGIKNRIPLSSQKSGRSTGRPTPKIIFRIMERQVKCIGLPIDRRYIKVPLFRQERGGRHRKPLMVKTEKSLEFLQIPGFFFLINRS